MNLITKEHGYYQLLSDLESTKQRDTFVVRKRTLQMQFFYLISSCCSYCSCSLDVCMLPFLAPAYLLIPVSELHSRTDFLVYFCSINFSGVRLSEALGTAATTGLLYQPWMIGEGDCEEKLVE
jgi:hypothetical protein